MSKLHLIGGEKGGVGKSVVARLLAQYMIDKKLPFSAFDSDRSHGALLRFYGDFSQEVNVNQFEDLDRVYESALEEPEKRVLLDLAAQTSFFLDQWIGDSGIAELAEETGLRPTYWHVMDSGRDSVDLLQKLLDKYGSDLNYVIVLNQVRGVFFPIFDKDPVKQKALDLGAKVFTLKRLHPPLMTKIDAASASFWGAANWADRELGFSLLERQRVKMWLKSSYESFDAIGV